MCVVQVQQNRALLWETVAVAAHRQGLGAEV